MRSHRDRAAGAKGAAAAFLALSGALCLGSIALPSGSARADEAPAAAAPQAGTWQSHKYTFQFLGFTSTYSCDGLADKLRELLLAAGARADVKSQPGACAAPFGRPDKFARADLKFYTLAPAESAPAESAPDAQPRPVVGVWRTVTFSNRSPRDLQIGDCELIEQFRNQVLPMFTTRNVVSHTTCVPYQESGSVIDLKFDVFAAVPAKKR